LTRNQLEYWNLQEKIRSNQASEAETQRANKAKEALTSRDLTEKSRHNVASEAYNLLGIQESERHNQATEGLTKQKQQMEYADIVYDNATGTLTDVAKILSGLFGASTGAITQGKKQTKKK
jgi:hypothetical protein